MINDPISDMLTRIRNANQVKAETVKMPSSKNKVEIAKILLDEGFIKGFNVEGDVKKELTITLKYGADKERVISGLKKISTPGLRVNLPCEKLPRVLHGLGIAIISTSKGMMSDAKARKLGVGGEVIAYIW
jgi:small subunit ribosomal protein S8